MSEPAARGEHGRILVVAYDFPPHAAIGTLRTLRLVRYLSELGWSVTVLTSAPATYLPGTPTDASLEQQVPPDVRVVRARALRPFDALVGRIRPRKQTQPPKDTAAIPSTPAQVGRVRSMKDWIDAALSIPDKESGWIVPGIAAALRAGLRERPDVIYSSAPPWSGQVIAYVVARCLRTPWVADFRDPWARAPWRNWGKPFRQRAAAALERRVVRRADAVLFVTRANLAEFGAFYGDAAARRFHFISNGCDAGDFRAIVPSPRPGYCVLLHAGSLYGGRNPTPVIHAIASAIDRGALDRATFRLRLLGSVSPDLDLAGECQRLGIQDIVEFASRVTRAESLREMTSASALLLVQTGTTVSIPAKAYEYLAAGRPILALTEEGETAALVRESGLGITVAPDEPPDRIEDAVLRIVEMTRRMVSAANPELFDAQVQTAAAAKLLDRFRSPRIRAAAGTVEEAGR